MNIVKIEANIRLTLTFTFVILYGNTIDVNIYLLIIQINQKMTKQYCQLLFYNYCF